MKSNIKGNFGVQGVVKPGAGADIIANSVISEIKRDVVIFCGGANDVKKE